MAVPNFIPEVWSLAIERQLQKIKVFENLVNTKYQGLVSYGNSVKIPSIGRIVASSYSNGGTITYQDIDDKGQTLLIDQRYIAPVYIDALDQVQAVPGMMSAVVSEMSLALRDVFETSIAGLYSDVSSTQTITETTTGVDSGNVFELLQQARIKFSVNHVPVDQMLNLVVCPYMYAAIVNSELLRKEDNNNVFLTGQVGEIGGFRVFVSNALTTSGTYGTDYQTNALAFTDSAISAVRQIMPNVSSQKSETKDGDWLRASMVWGRKIVRMDEIVRMNLLINKETEI